MHDEKQFRPAASTFLVDGDVVLLAPRSGDLFLLNDTAGLIWQALADGLGSAEIADTLATVLQRPQALVLQDCKLLLEEWLRLGLVHGADGAATSPVERSVESWWGATERGTAPAPDFTAAIDKPYRLDDFVFRLRTGATATDRDIHNFIGHLAAPDAMPSNWLLDVVPDEGRWRLQCNGRPIDVCDAAGLMPMIHGNLMVAAYRATPCLLGLHAAAVTVGDRCVLLAGIPGAGKSTLTAALLAHGFGYSSDDTVLLTEPPVRVRGVPMRLGLKEGSWPVIGSIWPELLTLPIHRRADGRDVRYWLPPLPQGGATQNPATASALVFPRYQAGASVAVRKLRTSEALVKLTQAGYDVPGVMNREIASRLIDWLESLRCCELVYGDLREAVHEVSTLAGRAAN